MLKPNGLFALVDNVVPDGSVGDYINAFERFRDPSHLRAWTMQEWRDALKKAHLAIGHEEQIYKKMEFKSWASRHDATMQALLRSMLARGHPGSEGGARAAGRGRGPHLPAVRRPVHRQTQLSETQRQGLDGGGLRQPKFCISTARRLKMCLPVSIWQIALFCR